MADLRSEMRMLRESIKESFRVIITRSAKVMIRGIEYSGTQAALNSYLLLI